MKCNLCPNKCNVERNKNIGFCNNNGNIKVALVSSHMYEEPCISGKNGSGTVFFSNCNLRCEYCQNYEISSLGKGKEISVERLKDIFLEIEKRGNENINLVSPTIYADKIKQAIILAKKEGLNIPIVYNTNGYENVETLKSLDGLIDIYLPDFKYIDNELGKKYSKVNNYADIVKEALFEMKRQVPKDIFSEDNMMKKGVIIRHLILPGNIDNTKGVLKWIKENLGKKQYISVMAQYFPTYNAKNIEELNRKITKEELKEVENYVYKLGFENGFIQEIGEFEEEYVPEFSLDNV